MAYFVVYLGYFTGTLFFFLVNQEPSSNPTIFQYFGLKVKTDPIIVFYAQFWLWNDPNKLFWILILEVIKSNMYIYQINYITYTVTDSRPHLLLPFSFVYNIGHYFFLLLTAFLFFCLSNSNLWHSHQLMTHSSLCGLSWNLKTHTVSSTVNMNDQKRRSFYVAAAPFSLSPISYFPGFQFFTISEQLERTVLKV